ncbi:MAG: hypothetical protein FVQ83_14060 [Chloroflexi bacterium]|nr:hypothetical protein [Chloroflexota bacterium]
MTNTPKRFIGEAIQVDFNKPPTLEKKPGCPDSFTWQGQDYGIIALLKEWHDYKRKGEMRRNIKPNRIENAERRGSWGVGRDYYRVQTDNGQIFDIYYDRAPQNVDQRKGGWFLFRELTGGRQPE